MLRLHRAGAARGPVTLPFQQLPARSLKRKRTVLQLAMLKSELEAARRFVDAPAAEATSDLKQVLW